MMQPNSVQPRPPRQLTYELLNGSVLQQVLQNARDRLLAPHWREEVATMSRAAWEPGHSPGWRQAVDCWFDDSRKVLAERRGITLTQHAELTKLTELIPVSTRTAMAPSVVDAMAQISSLDERSDVMARQALSTFIMQRDRLTASYRAALGAGGVDIDWRSWFEERISTWDNESGAATARTILRQDPHVYMQRLPLYW